MVKKIEGWQWSSRYKNANMVVSGAGCGRLEERDLEDVRKAPESLKESKGNSSEENKILLEPQVRHGEHESLPHSEPQPIDLFVCAKPAFNHTPITTREFKHKRSSTSLASLQNKAKQLLLILASSNESPTNPPKMLVIVMVYTKKDPKVNHLQGK